MIEVDVKHIVEISLPKCTTLCEVTTHISQFLNDYCEKNFLPLRKRSRGSRYIRILERLSSNVSTGKIKYQIRYEPAGLIKSLPK